LDKARRKGLPGCWAAARRKVGVKLARSFPRSTRVFLRLGDLPPTFAQLRPARLGNRLSPAAAAPLFHFTPAELPALVAAIPSQLRNRTLEEAAEIMAQRFRFRGIAQCFPDAIDWHAEPAGDKGWRWDLNRHMFLLTLARAHCYDDRPDYIAKIAEILRHWRRCNPCDPCGCNWNEAFEVAARLNNWLWVLFLLQGDGMPQPCREALLSGIYQHARYLHHFLETDIPNNHLLLEAKALYEAAVVLAPLPAAAKWRRTARKHFLRQFGRQVRSDGGHSEQSITYHRIVHAEAFEMLLFARRQGDLGIAAALREPLAAMSAFTSALLRSDGSFPVLGDATLIDTYYRFNPLMLAAVEFDCAGYKTAAVELGEDDLTYFLLGLAGTRRYASLAPAALRRRSTPLPASGYYVMEDETLGLHAVIDCGPFGDCTIPAHGHDDILSFDLALRGSALLVDSGTDGGAETAPDACRWRSYFRGAHAHNVPLVDGLNRSQLPGWRDVLRTARPLATHWYADDRINYFRGAHDGYRKQLGVLHRRDFLLIQGQFFCLVDRLLGRGDHHIESLLHLAHDKRGLLRRPGTVEILAGTAHVANLQYFGAAGSATIVRGQIHPTQGWVSIASGAPVAADVVCFGVQAALPFWSGVIVQDAARPQFQVRLETAHSLAADNRLPVFTIASAETSYLVQFLAAEDSRAASSAGLYDRLSVCKLQHGRREMLYDGA
jgi:uncharacterized heparinase superfamily protein